MPFKRKVCLFELTLYGIGIIIGAGIYVLIGKIAGIAGNGVWLSFLLASFIALFTGLSYAELSHIYNDDAAEYYFIKKTIGKEYLAQVIAWFILCSSILSGAVVLLGLSSYLSSWIHMNIIYLSFVTLLIFTYINYKGIKISTKINDISTILEISGLIIIIAGTLYLLLKGNASLPQITNISWSKTINAALLSFFAYIGFGSLVKISEEVENPKRNVPLAIILSIIITTILYVLVALSAIILVKPSELSLSNEPAALLASKINPNLKEILSITAIISTSNTLLLLLITSSRLLYGLAKHGIFPRVFSKIHKRFSTPYLAILAVSLLMGTLIFYKNISLIAEITNLWIFITYIFVNLSVIILRYKEKNNNHRINILNIGRFPLFSVLGILTTLFLIWHYFSTTHISIQSPAVYLTFIIIIISTLNYLLKRRKQ